MTEAERVHLREGAASLGVSLGEAQEARLWRYVELLLNWNEKINLTAVTELSAIVDKHLLDCLALLPLLPAGNDIRVIDVGTGAGLPALVLAIARPDLFVTAVESIYKKVNFVRTVVRELDLEVVVEPVRLEALAIPAPFDVAVSRATFEPAEWVTRGAELVRPGGLLIAMLSEQQQVPASPPGFTEQTLVDHRVGDAYRAIARYQRDR